MVLPDKALCLPTFCHSLLPVNKSSSRSESSSFTASAFNKLSSSSSSSSAPRPRAGSQARFWSSEHETCTQRVPFRFPLMHLLRVCVVYWYSSSNPRTKFIHYDNCLVIRSGPPYCDPKGDSPLSLHATVPASKVGSRSASEHPTSKRSIVPAVQGRRGRPLDGVCGRAHRTRPGPQVIK